MRRASIAAVAIAIAVAVCGLLVVLLDGAPRRSGTNNVAPSAESARLAPGERSCQPEDVPGGTERVAVVAAPVGGGTARFTVTLRRGRDLVAAGRAAGATVDGRFAVALRPTPPAGPALVCVRNDGRRQLALLGLSDTIAVDYYRAGDETWLQASPAVARHFGFGKAGFLGAWTLWLALVLIAAAWIGSWRALAAAGKRA